MRGNGANCLQLRPHALWWNVLSRSDRTRGYLGGAGRRGCRRTTLYGRIPRLVRGMALTARGVCSICTGTFVLAQAGLLNHRTAVTHWNWCERLAERFPEIRVE